MTLRQATIFLCRTQKVLTIKEKMDKFEIIKFKTIQRTPLRKLKMLAMGWEKYAIHLSDRGLIQNI